MEKQVAKLIDDNMKSQLKINKKDKKLTEER